MDETYLEREKQTKNYLKENFQYKNPINNQKYPYIQYDVKMENFKID